MSLWLTCDFAIRSSHFSNEVISIIQIPEPDFAQEGQKNNEGWVLSEFLSPVWYYSITEAVSRYLELRFYPDGGQQSAYQH